MIAELQQAEADELAAYLRLLPYELRKLLLESIQAESEVVFSALIGGGARQLAVEATEAMAKHLDELVAA